MKIFSKISIATIVVASLAFGFTGPIAVFAADAPSLGSLVPYGVVSSTFTNSNTAPQTIVNGAVCYTTAPDTQPLTITGVEGACPAGAGTDQLAALNTALNNLNNQACTDLGAAVALNSVTGHLTGVYTPGCYSSSGAGATSMTITTGTTVTLNGAGVYIFKSAGALNPAANTSIVLTNGATADKVFWAPVEATTIGANTAFVGNILDAAGITIGHFSTLLGRALAFGGTVTTDANTITVPATLRVEKAVVGGTAVASDFTVNVKTAGGAHVSGSPAAGVTTPGAYYSLAAGTYTVSENANSSYTSLFGTDCGINGSVTLAAGDNKLCTIVNTNVAVSATPTQYGSSSYFEPLPLINITKIPSPLALPSGAGSVTYTYTVTNVGKVAMNSVWVRDDKCASVAFISGDTNSDSKLDIDETWIYRCTKTVSATETNVATAHGNANGWDGYDYANATVVVGKSITPPLIHLVKKPNVFVLSAGGGAVTYTYTVTNPGTVPLSDVSITDNKCTGLPGRVVGHPGDLNKNNLLESNETWSFTCQTNITQTTTNIGTAVGHANGLIAVDLSPATVAVVAPSFPNTGLPPEGKSIPWNMIILAGALILASTSLVLVIKKHKI